MTGTIATGASAHVPFEVDQENGGQAPQVSLIRRKTVSEKVTDYLSNPTLANTAKRPAVPPMWYSPVHVLSFLSFLLTVGIIVAAIMWKDGTAIVAVGTISLASSVVGYASWWKPILMNRTHTNKVPRGDVVIRTREGAFVIVKCTEEVARELYFGTEECEYYVSDRNHRAFMGLGTVLLMVSVVLLGNCNFASQVFIGASYITLNGLYWGMAWLPKEYFWDLSRYEWEDKTPEDARDAHTTTDANDQREGTKSFTRTLWYAIRETKRTGWVERSGAAPGTPQWKEWLQEALAAAKRGDRKWPAVARKDEIMRASLNEEPAGDDEKNKEGEDSQEVVDHAEQHAPLLEVQPRTNSNQLGQGSF